MLLPTPMEATCPCKIASTTATLMPRKANPTFYTDDMKACVPQSTSTFRKAFINSEIAETDDEEITKT